MGVNSCGGGCGGEYKRGFRLDIFSHLRMMTLSSLSNFMATRLGHMKTWAACNSLDWVTCLPLHFTLAYIVYRESQTCLSRHV